MTFLFFTGILISVSTTAVARRRKIKEAAAPKESETSKSDKPNESDSNVTDKKPMVHTHHILSILRNSVISIHLSHFFTCQSSKPPTGSKRKASSTNGSDGEDKSPPQTRQGQRKKHKAVTPSRKGKKASPSKTASPGNKASSEESPLKTASNALVLESHNSSPDNNPPKVSCVCPTYYLVILTKIIALTFYLVIAG